VRHETYQRIVWWLCLLVAPLVLAVIELFHPAEFTEHPGMYQYLSLPEAHDATHKALAYFGPDWWFTLHMIQTPMMALVAVGMWLLVSDVRTVHGALAVACAWLSRLAAFVFLIYYTVLDAIGGIGLGRTIVLTQDMVARGELSDQELQGVIVALNATWTDPWVGGVGSFVSETGSWAAFAMTALAAAARFFAKQGPWAALVLLGVAGWILQLSHAALHGPFAFMLLAAAAIWLAWWERQQAKATP
jgi:hypothetical protein